MLHEPLAMSEFLQALISSRMSYVSAASWSRALEDECEQVALEEVAS